ncbi:MAG: flippase-like domain-containing protein [Chitinivibrionia bacterium]|nr:flippase-like domain-containing protein [Chitinivibrionia bacterium]
MNTKKLLKGIAAVLMCAVVVYFIVRTLRASAGELRSYRFAFNYWYVISSFALLAASSLFLPWAWKIICAFFGAHLSYAASLQIQFLSYITRLVPGRVLTLLSQVAVAKEQQIPPHVSVATVVIFTVFGTLVGVQVFLASMLLWPGVGPAIKLACAAAACALFALLLWSKAVETIVSAVMRKIKGQAVAFHMRPRDALAIQAIILASWAVYALALHLLMNSLA